MITILLFYYGLHLIQMAVAFQLFLTLMKAPKSFRCMIYF